MLDSAAKPRANATCDCRDFTHRCIAAKSDCRFFNTVKLQIFVRYLFSYFRLEMKHEYKQNSAKAKEKQKYIRTRVYNTTH